MPRGVKVALPGKNALTNFNPADFSLYVDGTTDHILIKERSRGTNIVSSGSTQEVEHNLGYPPLVMVMVQIPGLDFEYAYGLGNYSPWRVWTDTTKLYMLNGDTGDRTFAHFVFYDQL